MTCYNCNKEGHMSRDCPEPRADNRPPRSQSFTDIECYNCGKTGHMSRDCEEERRDGGGGGGGGGGNWRD